MARDDIQRSAESTLPAPEREKPFNPQSRWECPGGVEEDIGDEESDHAPDVVRLLEIGTQVPCRSVTHAAPGIANRGTGTGAHI